MKQSIILKLAGHAGYINGYYGSTIRKVIKNILILSILLGLIYTLMHILHYSIEIKRAETVLWKIT